MDYAPADKHTQAKESRIVEVAVERSNRLLVGLPGVEHRKLIARCEPVELAFGEVLCEQGESIQHVYFPIDSFVSEISRLDEHSRLEVGLVGAEGMVGISLLFGVDIAPGRALVQGAGSALRLSAARFSRELQQSPALEQTLKRYLNVVMTRITRAAACGHFHPIEARLARWLLMIRDRACCDEFKLTHEITAYMLGVRRESISESASALQKCRLIRYRRGKVVVLDGPGLEALACSCYADAMQNYARVMRH